MTVFRETDRRSYVRRVGDRNPLVWGQITGVDGDEVETATEYSCDTTAAIARLDVMGFTIGRTRRNFEAGRLAEVATYLSWAEERPDPHWFADKLAFLQSLSFDAYLVGLEQILAQGLRPQLFDDDKNPELSPVVRYILGDNDEFLLGFFAADVRYLIRAACEVAAKPSQVVQDITELVEGGYYARDEAVCQAAIQSLVTGHLENSNRVVLTEGSTDAQILQRALHLLYPHLLDYYSFLDFEGGRVPGGAGQLVSVVKAFAAAGIGNRVIALFDNDAAAHDARRSLAQITLPPNIAVLSYPPLELLRNYPTLGPSGGTSLDVNGLAASIELYLGEDVLRRPDGTFSPVQWKGYIEPVARYQGEVMGKTELQAAFTRKISAAESNPEARRYQDWTGLDTILRAVFTAFADEALYLPASSKKN